MHRYTPLRLAAWKGTAAAVKALLDAGADFKMKDYMGFNILSECTPGCRKCNVARFPGLTCGAQGVVATLASCIYKFTLRLRD